MTSGSTRYKLDNGGGCVCGGSSEIPGWLSTTDPYQYTEIYPLRDGKNIVLYTWNDKNIPGGCSVYKMWRVLSKTLDLMPV